MRVLLTNDDGISSPGLQAMAQALRAAGVDVLVLAPDRNRSAIARSVTLSRPLKVLEHQLADGTGGLSCDGTPVDCVRLAAAGVFDATPPDMVVSGINFGANLGDDITYSGTVAAALEGMLIGLPAVAVSQASPLPGRGYDFREAAAFTAALVTRVPLTDLSPDGTVLNVNVPAGPVRGVEVTTLGRRVYRDTLGLEGHDDGIPRYRLYAEAPGYEAGEGTDFAAVAGGRISVTPVRFELVDLDGFERLARLDLSGLLEGVGPSAG